ncbi:MULTISPECIES: hypothetical protein [Caproicibacterium]|uniref:Uncharacterized protein n=1 Tax=Caproicibacterium argilliputei TaxID=3030016 RepID=A0AA97DDC5_9FIRM|nr:hypothetical protein [Caproicibacterium argilliputei]WOC33472.1 hypothetical protein PXC00_06290 [Caproicibacterium argilliputei]
MKIRKAKTDPESVPTKLKDLKLTSVDFCQQGANPDAYIRLAKSKDVPQQQDTRPAFERAVELLKTAFHATPEPSGEVRKDAQTFSDISNKKDILNSFWQYNDALDSSFRSIINDQEMEDSVKHELMLQSLSQFTEAMTANIDGLYTAAPGGVSKEKGDENMDEKEFDLSGMTADEQNAFKALLAKSKPKKPAAGEDGVPPKDEAPVGNEKKDGLEKSGSSANVENPATAFLRNQYASPNQQADTRKSATGGVEDPLPPAVQAAIDRMNGLSNQLEKSLKQQAENSDLQVAKKYEALGDSAEIAKALGEARTAGDTAYNAYVSALDKALEVTKKTDSMLFGEVGKSASGSASTAVGKAEGIAKSLQEKDPALTPQQAMAKAFEQHPELEAEYEKEYEGGKY